MATGGGQQPTFRTAPAQRTVRPLNVQIGWVGGLYRDYFAAKNFGGEGTLGVQW